MRKLRLDMEFCASVSFGEVLEMVSESMLKHKSQPDHVTMSIRHPSGVYGFGGGDCWPQALVRAYEYQES